MRQMKLFAAALVVLAGAASAQNIDKFVVSGDDAKKAKAKNEISADTAEKITQACVAFAKEKKLVGIRHAEVHLVLRFQFMAQGFFAVDVRAVAASHVFQDHSAVYRDNLRLLPADAAVPES